MNLYRITIYRLVVYGLGIIAAVSLLFSALGLLTIPFSQLCISLVVLLVTCYVANRLMAKVWRVTPSHESWLISALILYLILAPARSVSHIIAAGIVGIIAMASKYIIAYRGRHIFNPAALATAAIALTGLSAATWWVGTPSLALLVAVLAGLVVMRLRLYRLAAGYVVAAVTTAVFVAVSNDVSPAVAFNDLILASPFLFLGGIMLTEPATLPGSKRWHILYGALVGVLLTGQLTLFGQFVTPSLALLFANLFAYALNKRQGFTMTLRDIHRQSDGLYRFQFSPSQPLSFTPGQYMHWTVPVKRLDGRGNRRMFSIASAPGDDCVTLGIRVSPNGSAYKRSLLSMKPGDTLQAGFITGDFTLPKNAAEPVVLIASGIGVTPFISMIRHALLHPDDRSLTLYYFVRSKQDIYEAETLAQASKAGHHIHYLIDKSPEALGDVMSIDQATTYYVSGPPLMVDGTRQVLTRYGVPKRHIKTDYFDGY
ncbi:MAG: hypothetical protein JWM37_284 [Candidatus Saccharibacteria bacterium]|nr:hypothetical protein [Candidatus Saccharibacteria bacterium]